MDSDRMLHASMGSLVMLRWILPVGRPVDSARELITTLVAPSVRASGWLSSPGTTHHVSDEGREAWVTVVTQVDDATEVQDELAGLLRSSPAVETGHDPLLVSDAEWYRAALQQITHVSLDVIEARGTIPMSEYHAFESPMEAAPRLLAFLNEVSPTYRRACPSYESTERFWLDFFRQGPAPERSRPGRLLWNLAG